MPDAPDGFKLQNSSKLNVVSDMAELAARLGSPANFDRSGAVIFADDMSHGFAPYVRFTVLNDAVYEVLTQYSLVSGYSLALTAGTTVAKYAEILKGVILPFSDLAGFEVQFTSYLQNSLLQIMTQFDIDGRFYQAAIQFDLSNGGIKYLDSSGNYQPLLSFGFDNFLLGYHIPVKLVVDLNTKKYVRVRVGETNLDDLDYSIYSPSTSVLNDFYGTIRVIKDGAIQDRVYLGSFVMTYGEPA